MSTTQLRKNTKKRIDEMNVDDLRAVSLFVEFVASAGVRQPFAERMKQAEADIAAGRFKSLAKIRGKFARV